MTEITQELLQAHFHYNGRDLVWKKPNRGRTIGAVAGCHNTTHGYRDIYFMGKKHKAHRLIWLYIHGKWPNMIDHINRNRLDNRLENLREADHVINNRNSNAYNRLGVKGVSAWKDRFHAYICVGSKKHHLGTFATIQDAAHARRQAELRYWGGTDKSVILQ